MVSKALCLPATQALLPVEKKEVSSPLGIADRAVGTWKRCIAVRERQGLAAPSGKAIREPGAIPVQAEPSPTGLRPSQPEPGVQASTNSPGRGERRTRSGVHPESPGRNKKSQRHLSRGPASTRDWNQHTHSRGGAGRTPTPEAPLGGGPR